MRVGLSRIWILIWFLLIFSSSYLSAKELEDYGYTRTERKEDEYSRDMINKKSPYLQEIPQGPSSLEESSLPPEKTWSRPEELNPAASETYRNLWEQFINPPQGRAFAPEVNPEAQRIKTAEEVSAKVKQEFKPVVEKVTGKSAEVVFSEERQPFGVTPLVKTPEEATQEEPAPEASQKAFSADAWQIIMKEGRITIKPPEKTTQKELEAVYQQLVELVGRGAEVSLTNLERGIEIKLQ